MLGGNVKGGFKTLSNNIQANKTKIAGTLAATAVAKILAKGFRVGRLAKLGPLAVRL